LTTKARKALRAVQSQSSEIAFEHLAIDVQAELSAIQRDLASVALDVVDLIRWKSGALGKRNPLKYKRFEIKQEGSDWQTISRPINFRYRLSNPISLPENFNSEIQRELDRLQFSPAARSLIREARDQWPDALRSSLILAVAALEVGIKQCLVNLDPSLESELIDGQAPSTTTMMTHYLDRTVRLIRPELEEYLLPKKFRTLVSEAVRLRNVIVHRPRRLSDADYLSALAKLSPVWMDRLITLASDLLWVFDYLNGLDQAINRISAETQHEFEKRVRREVSSQF
ncbi:MAG: hypothetical protein ACRDHN_15065, partial [Thermomicrobiales bacterium]